MVNEDELTEEAGKAISWWRRIRIWVGYVAFVAALVYGLANAPDEVWRIEPVWLALAVAVLAVSILFQVLQVIIFLRCHGISGEWFVAALFTLRKGVLNVLLPARSGTLLVLRTLTKRYSLKWYDYVYFSVAASIASLDVSIIAAGFVWLGWQAGMVLALVSILAAKFIPGYVRLRYLERIGELLLVAAGIYLSFLAGFWCLINGLGWELTVGQAATFAIALNLLALVSITPGNLGVREGLLGVVAPLLSLPISVGILVGACFYVLRLLVSSVFLAALECIEVRRASSGSLTK